MVTDPTAIVVAVIALLSTVVSVLLTNRYATRAMRRAQDEANKKVDAEAYSRARENYAAALAEQDKRIARINAAADHDRVEYERDLHSLAARMETLERDRDTDRARLRRTVRDLRLLAEWARNLLRELRAQGVAYTAPPIRLGDTDPDGFPPIDQEQPA